MFCLSRAIASSMSSQISQRVGMSGPGPSCQIKREWIIISVGLSLAATRAPSRTLFYINSGNWSWGSGVDTIRREHQFDEWFDHLAPADFTKRHEQPVRGRRHQLARAFRHATFLGRVIAPQTPTLATLPAAAGSTKLNISGSVGPDYTIQISTNLAGTNWTTLTTTNPAQLPFAWSETIQSTIPSRFCRVRLGP
jgi:hypothetical protein